MCQGAPRLCGCIDQAARGLIRGYESSARDGGGVTLISLALIGDFVRPNVRAKLPAEAGTVSPD